MTTSKVNGKVFVVGHSQSVTRMFFERGYTIVNKQQDADIVCFIGGADISPSLYDQQKNSEARVHTYKHDDDRDLTAWNMLTEKQLVAGICRGGQLANVMSGGSMIQHMTGHHNSHKVYDTVWNKEVLVASSHHQMMVPGEGAEVFAYCEGIGHGFLGEKGPVERPKFEPEVLWYNDTKSLCYQGHPEWNPIEGTNYFFDLLELVRD